MEQWKDIPGYEGIYQVSSLERVRSLDRIAKSAKRGDQIIRGRLLRPGAASNGYKTVALCKDGRPKSHTVHSLVAKAFLGECPEGCEIDHINGDRQDNSPANLRYVTHHINTRNVTVANSASGVLGVYKNGSAWMAQIKYKGRMTHLGTFPTIEEAAAARAAFEAKVNYRELEPSA